MRNAPLLLVYSLIFPAYWFAIGTSMSYALPNVRLGAGGLLVIIYGTVLSICWLFARSRKRLFSKSETIRLIIYCSAWAALCESLSLLSLYLEDDAGSQLDDDAMLLILGGTVLFDAILLSIAFFLIPKRLIPKYLGKRNRLVEEPSKEPID